MKQTAKRFLSVVLAATLMVACFVLAPASAVSAATTDEIAIEATSVEAMPGDTVTIDVNITSNPGIIGMRLFVEYDESLLTLIKAEDKGVLGTSQFTETYGSPFALVWSNGTATSNYTFTGTVATLTFKVAENFEKNMVATVSLTTKSVNDILSVDSTTLDVTPVTPNFTEGKVSVYPFAFYGSSLTLYNDISLNFVVNNELETLFGCTDFYVVFNFNDQEYTVNTYTKNGSYYMFRFNNVGPKQLKDVVSATLYAKRNGEDLVSPVKQHSVANYCYNSLETRTGPEYAELRTLMVDLLNYGTAAQYYSDYKLDNLINAELTNEQKAMGTSETPNLESDLNTQYSTIDNPTISWYGANLYLYDSVQIRFYIEADSKDGLSVKVKNTTDNNEYTISNSAITSAGGKYYVFTFDKFKASQMRNVILVTVMKDGVAVSDTLSYDIETYAYNQNKEGSTATEQLKNYTIAMMKYGDAAYNYTH